MTDVAAAELTPRAQQTRAAIVEAALALFRERGYEATTMREIASRAGVSTGNAYYYFSSKEELLQEFYATSHAEHLAASRARLDGQDDLGGPAPRHAARDDRRAGPVPRVRGHVLQARGRAEQPAEPVQQGGQPGQGTPRSGCTGTW